MGLGLKCRRDSELISALSFFLAAVKWPSARRSCGGGDRRGEREEETKKRKKSGENRDFVLSRETGGRRRRGATRERFREENGGQGSEMG